MRVGLVIYGSLGTRTGGYLYDRRLVRHMTEHGDDVDVVSLAWRNYGRHLCDNVSSALARKLGGARYDVILEDELNHPSLVAVNSRLRKRGGCPIVSIVHCLRADEHAGSPLRSLYAATERRYLTGVDAAVFCSQATRTAAERLARKRLHGVVARPGCDHVGGRFDETALALRARAGGPLRVVTVANVLPNKGLHVLVEALSRLPRERWRLTVVGSLTMQPGYVRRVRHLIERSGVTANVQLVGSVPSADVHRFLGAAHVLAGPSMYEALGIAYLEAMSLGLPVIATSAGGACEVVEHGRVGFLVAPGEVETLASHLRLLAADRELLLDMSLAARRSAGCHPTWDESLGYVRDLLESLVDGSRVVKPVAS